MITDISILPLDMWWLPPLVSFIVSIFGSTGGISGAFLLLPFQISVLNFTSPAVSATNQLYNIFGIPGGLIRYIKEGRMLWQLALIVAIGTLPGVVAGAYIRILWLPDPDAFKVFASFVLFYIGIRLLIEIIKPLKKKTANAENKFSDYVKNHQKSKGTSNLPKIKVLKFNMQKLEYEFVGEYFSVSVLIIFLISMIVGIVGGIYGIGGGAIIVPIYVAFFGLPVYTIAGAALMGTFATSIFGVITYELLSLQFPNVKVAPDWVLGFLFGIGGFLGMYAGARLQKFLPANIIKGILLVIILFTAFNYLSTLLKFIG